MRQKVKLIAITLESDFFSKGDYYIDYDVQKVKQVNSLDTAYGGVSSTSFELVEFYLISDEYPKVGDHFAELLRTNKYGIFQMDNENDPQRTDCKKVIATPNQIGLIVSYKSTTNVETYREIDIGNLQGILNNGGECEIEVEERTERVVLGGFRFDGDDGLGPREFVSNYMKPKLIDGKVIIHFIDNLLKEWRILTEVI